VVTAPELSSVSAEATVAASRRPVSRGLTEPEPDALAFLSEEEVTGDEGEVVAALEVAALDMDRYAMAAERGALRQSDVMALESIGKGEDPYTRSRVLLLMNAQHQGDDRRTKRYLDDLMVQPEHRYNPVYLTDLARWHANQGDFVRALEKAKLAERHWARLPSDLIFLKKAEIYEIQASSYQGLFYGSDNDLQLLNSAISHWERYRSHVVRRARTDMVNHADEELSTLQDIRTRLEY
jgi:hypothetical protein